MMIDFSPDQSRDWQTNDSRLQVGIWMRNLQTFQKTETDHVNHARINHFVGHNLDHMP